MKRWIIGLALSMALCTAVLCLRADDADKEKALRTQLVGTWRMVSGKYGGQVFTFPDTDITYKHVTPTGFIWATYKKDTGRVYRAGGGFYSLKGDHYTEKVEYGVGDDFEIVKNAQHSFTCKIEGDKWQHNGKLSNGQTIEEVWERVKPMEAGKTP